MTLVGGELLSELPSTSPRVSEDEGGLGWPGAAPPVVNFINVIRTNISYERHFSTYM